MDKAIYPGTFDPITYGHIDVIKRAVNLFNEVIVAVFKTPSKGAIFSYNERLSLVRESVKSIKKVKVEGFNELIVDFAKKRKTRIIIRGIRMISDFEYEFQMALTNRKISRDIETVFLMPHPNYSYISSKLLRESFALGANLKEFLPPESIAALTKKYKKNH